MVLPAEVRRVVSLAPNVTDILYALGAGSKIAGVTHFAEIPSGDAPKPSVGDPIEPSLEKIVALRPDLVLVSKTINRLETVESLDRLKIPVYATDARTVEGMLATIRQVAQLVGAKREGEELAARLAARLEALRARLAGRKPKRVLFVAWEDPLITTGENTFVADALRWAGAENVVKVRQDWPHISLEEIVHLQPQDLIFPATGTGTAEEIRQSLLRRLGWRDLKAVQEGRVLVVSDAINRPSPALVDVIDQLAHELHRGAFREAKSPTATAARSRPHGPQRIREGIGAAPVALGKEQGARAGASAPRGEKPWRR